MTPVVGSVMAREPGTAPLFVMRHRFWALANTYEVKDSQGLLLYRFVTTHTEERPDGAADVITDWLGTLRTSWTTSGSPIRPGTKWATSARSPLSSAASTACPPIVRSVSSHPLSLVVAAHALDSAPVISVYGTSAKLKRKLISINEPIFSLRPFNAASIHAKGYAPLFCLVDGHMSSSP
jgi:hypothetical protein